MSSPLVAPVRPRCAVATPASARRGRPVLRGLTTFALLYATQPLLPRSGRRLRDLSGHGVVVDLGHDRRACARGDPRERPVRAVGSPPVMLGSAGRCGRLGLAAAVAPGSGCCSCCAGSRGSRLPGSPRSGWPTSPTRSTGSTSGRDGPLLAATGRVRRPVMVSAIADSWGRGGGPSAGSRRSGRVPPRVLAGAARLAPLQPGPVCVGQLRLRAGPLRGPRAAPPLPRRPAPDGRVCCAYNYVTFLLLGPPFRLPESSSASSWSLRRRHGDLDPRGRLADRLGPAASCWSGRLAGLGAPVTLMTCPPSWSASPC